jgi:hypothetical protein
MENKTKCIFIILAIIVFSIGSCQKINQDKFIEEEMLELKSKIGDILTEFGYTDFSIHTYYHKNYGNREISKSVSTMKIFGDEIPVNAINNIEYNNQKEESKNLEIINNGYIDSRTLVVNYDEVNEGKIFYEYISIVVLIDKIEQGEINKLLKLFNNYILNNNRGDTIYINSK